MKFKGSSSTIDLMPQGFKTEQATLCISFEIDKRFLPAFLVDKISDWFFPMKL